MPFWKRVRQRRYDSRSVTARLVRVFLVQALVVSLAVLLAVLATAKVVEDVLVKEALEGEAEHFWSLYEQDPYYARPNTDNLRGYLERPGNSTEVPPWLKGAEPGYRRMERTPDNTPVVHVSDRYGARLYLVFDEVQVSNLALLFGVLPLALVLIAIYGLSWVGYRLSSAAVSPIVKLARRVEEFDLATDSAEDLHLDEFESFTDSEISSLALALQHFTERFESSVARERNFTRNASHELRTPLTVLKGNVMLLQQRRHDPDKAEEILERMSRNVRDMEQLLETLLMLARAGETELPDEPLIINDLLASRIEQLREELESEERSPVALNYQVEALLQIRAPDRVLEIVFNNLLRNALSNTDEGSVNVLIRGNSVTISDTGRGMDEETLKRVAEPFFRGGSDYRGFGLGLAIVSRLCQRFSWEISFSSRPGSGTSVKVVFPEGEVLREL